jgi:hypothetical protein
MIYQFLEYIIRTVARTVVTEDECRFCVTSREISIGFASWDEAFSHVLEEHFFRAIRGLCNSNAHVKYLGHWLLDRHEQ